MGEGIASLLGDRKVELESAELALIDFADAS